MEISATFFRKALSAAVLPLFCLCLWAQQADTTWTKKQPAAMADSLRLHQLHFASLSMRTKLTWEEEKTTQNFTGVIRLQQDSLIWISLSGAMGIEGFRLLVSPDTFKIINRLGSEYAIREYSAINRWLLFPLSFDMLQQLVAGQLLEIPDGVAALSSEDSATVLYFENNKMVEKVWLNTENYTVRRILLKDKMWQQDMTLTFDAYKILNGRLFPYKRLVEVHRAGTGFRLQMEITRLTLDEPLSFPFDINERYTKVE